MRQLARRLRAEDGGFTLIELMVVVLVIGVLMAIAVPTYLGARTRSQDAAAKSSLRTAMTAATVLYTDAQTFATANESSSGLRSVEGSLTYKAAATASTGTKVVSVKASATDWIGSVKSASGTCWFIKTISAGTVTYGKTTSGTCAATTSVSYRSAW